ncbi:MAG: deoxyribodipyrimidine photo-lyase [Rhizobiaceae bacterium]|nr:deoxyribodipyrimidine photo-lyase [Rhizobiaceae bacterium]
MPADRRAADDRPAVVLFRSDLRMRDNRALAAAVASGKPVIPVFILEDAAQGGRQPGAARRWWLHHSLEKLGKALDALGSPLVLRRGRTALVHEIVAEHGADMVLWNRRYDPAAVAVDTAMKAGLRKAGIAAESFEGHLLHEPSVLKTSGGGPYRVYTPFWRALAGQPEPRDPLAPPKSLRPPSEHAKSDSLASWRLLPTTPDWAGGLRKSWRAGEEAAHESLDDFLDGGLDDYAGGRDIPGRDATSRLSPHLAHGEITPYQIVHALRSRRLRAPARDIERFRMEIGWREFCYHLLFHNPGLATKNYNAAFDAFPWREDANLLARWQRGTTGYPIVDAGMRQLWQTGWMHNRVRMIVASFLVKHLLIDWRQGEEWFWDTLVDADPASNPANWQWVAGCGADAAPYFRVFNPILQGEKFDPGGDYVSSFVPELDGMPSAHIHKPWEAAAGKRKAGAYPSPIVDHRSARERALEAYATIRRED